MSPSARRLAIAPLFAALLIVVLHSAASAGPTPTPATVRIVPADQTVAAGGDLTFDITVEGISDPDGLAGYEVALLFDPAMLQFTSYDHNIDYLESTGRDVMCVPHLFDDDGDGEADPGFVQVGCVSFAANPAGPTSDGTLGTFVFSAICGGNGDLIFDRVGLSDPLGDTIPEAGVDGTVEVTGDACPTPTPEPTATPTPSGFVGDANCDDSVDAIDAALVLQLTAGLIGGVPCPDGADVNSDGSADAIDSALILQFVAGIISSLT